MDTNEVSQKLRKWLELVSNDKIDPWKDIYNGDDDVHPLRHDAKSVDPTQDFADVSDLYSECSSDEESSSLEEENNDENEKTFSYRGHRDEDGLFHHSGEIAFDNGDVLRAEFKHGIRHGDAVIISPRNNISRIIGTYVDGKLQGKGQVIDTETTVTDCFFKDGVIHGPIRAIDLKKFREFRRQLGFVGTYSSGIPGGAGPCWQYKEGGGYLYGQPNAKGEFSGDEIAFIYPDLYTCYVGSFQNGVMLNAVEATIRNAEVNDLNIMKLEFKLNDENNAKNYEKPPESILEEMDAKISIRDKRKKYKQQLKNGVNFSLSTRTYIGDQPLRPDPYESRYIECRTSTIPNSGEGIYAKTDLAKDTIVAFYNGVRIPYEILGRPPEKWSNSGYKIHVNADWISGLRMDIPEEYIDLSVYRATLGHKLNHSFEANCFAWFFDHPRFGIIPCEKTTRDVKKGEELTLDYEYDLNNCPEWFKEAFNSYIKETDKEKQQYTLNAKYLNYLANS